MANSNGGFYTGSDEVTFAQIVLNHLTKILEISSIDLHQGYMLFPQSGSRSEIKVDNIDTRKSYYQAVESLAFILTSWYDEATKEEFASFDKILNDKVSIYLKENKTEIEEELKAQKEIGVDIGDIDDQRVMAFAPNYRLGEKVRSAKRMFRQLNVLLHTNDYLKGAIYEE